MEKECIQCGKSFEVTDLDRSYLDKFTICVDGKAFPYLPPSMCPDCRLKRRLAWRNDRNLYERTCDITGKKLIATFHPDAPVTVYDKDYWWSDNWDPLDYEQDYDFSKSFTEQYGMLLKNVPFPHVFTAQSENSLYTNYNMWNNNCYMCFTGNKLENSLYCYNAEHSNDVMDCFFVADSEFCYECVHCDHSYRLYYSLHCTNCSDSYFLEDCTGCSHCFMCSNLRHKEYYMHNQPYSKEEYEEKLRQYQLCTHSGVNKAREEWIDERLKYPKRATMNINAEGCTGDYIANAKNCTECFIIAKECEDLRYVLNGFPSFKDGMDATYCGEQASQIYESIASGGPAQRVSFCHVACDGSHDVHYSNMLFNCHDCFGCVCLRNKSYCILNKQYTKEEYEDLLPRIIAHMREHAEWGIFPDPKISPFVYNETVACEYFPLTQREALEQGFTWREESRENVSANKNFAIDSIHDVPETVVDEVYCCTVCGKNYRLTKVELQYLKEMHIPVPRACFDCRHLARMRLAHGRNVYERACDNCGASMHTSFSPKEPEQVFCEACYAQEVY